MNPTQGDTIYHQSQPETVYYPPSTPYTQGVIQPPPPPPSAPNQEKNLNARIEEGIDNEVISYLSKAKNLGQSAARVVKQWVVPIAFIWDLVSMFIRFLVVVFLVMLPVVYDFVQTNPWVHYPIYVISGLGIAVGIPVALFSSIWKYTSLREKRDTAVLIQQRRKRNEQVRYYKGLIRSSVLLIWVAGADVVLMTLPFFFSINGTDPRTRLLAEGIMLIVPIVATIVTMISEHETRSDAHDTSTAIGTAAAIGILKTAARRLSVHDGTFQDSTAVQHAMSGDLTAAIEAGVAARADVQYMTLAEIARMLGYNDAKDSSIRKAFSRVAAVAFTKGVHGVKKDLKKGYLVPETAVLQLYQKYVQQASSNIVKLPTPTKKKKKQIGILRSAWERLFGSGENDEISPQEEHEQSEKIVALREVNR